MRWRLRDPQTPESVRLQRRSKRYARRQAREEAKAAAESAAWLQQNRTRVDAASMQNLWAEQRDRLSDPLLRLAVRYLSWGESLQQANEALQKGLRMPAAGLSSQQYDAALQQVLGLEQLALILKHSGLPDAVQQSVLQSAVSVAFPTSGEGAQALRALSAVLRQVNQTGKKELPFGYARASSSVSHSPREGSSRPSGPTGSASPFQKQHIKPGWKPQKPSSRDNGEF